MLLICFDRSIDKSTTLPFGPPTHDRNLTSLENDNWIRQDQVPSQDHPRPQSRTSVIFVWLLCSLPRSLTVTWLLCSPSALPQLDQPHCLLCPASRTVTSIPTCPLSDLFTFLRVALSRRKALLGRVLLSFAFPSGECCFLLLSRLCFRSRFSFS